MHIQVNEHEGQVFAQATGQMPFPLEKVSETVYTFEMVELKSNMQKI